MAELGRLGLVLHPRRDVSAVTGAVVDWAGRRGVAVHVAEFDGHRVPGAVPVPEAELASSDALVSVGGDGTMLGALRLVVDDPRPVLGVNMGRLGFLVEIEPPELLGALDRLAAGDVTVEHHSCLRITIGTDRRVAFNDLALSRRPGDGTVNAILTIDDQQYGYYRADAVIMATPTGSTAHSYSAGGPLLSPVTDAVVITPVAPMSGISRPLVLGAGERVEFDLLPAPPQPAGPGRSGTDEEPVGRAAVETDGRVVDHLEPGRTVHAELHRDAGLVVRLDVRVHRQRSQAKLSLLDLPLLPEQLRELLPAHVRDRLARREPP